jgi:hypothetical protein
MFSDQDARPDSGDDLVELRKFTHVHEAEIAVSTLESAHIDAILRDSSFGGIRPETSGAVAVLVRRSQLTAARELLDAPTMHDAAPGGVTCANCGQQLQGTICPNCDKEERETYLTPANTRAAIGKLKLAVLIGVLALMLLPTIIDRLSRVDEKAVLTALAIVGGLVLLVVVLKFFVTGSDERL